MFLNVNKPKGITSHDVVDEVRKVTGEKKVGHAGTLDPFAEGVLVVGVGRESTKKLGNITKDSEKEYIAVMELGKISSTGDLEGETREINTDFDVRESEIREVLTDFEGRIKQLPPRYSAVKIAGEPAYRKARRGDDFEVPEREVYIREIELLAYNHPYLKIRVVCGSGTYIRSLAEDIGEKLKTGAYLTELTRVRVGDFKIEDSKTLEELKIESY